MKRITYSILVVMLGLFYSCGDDVKYVSFKLNEPVFMDAEEFRNEDKIKDIKEARTITKQGKMCFYEGYLYISEPEKGIHIIDNRDSSSPQNVGFIELQGNVDISIRNNVLYADAYVDLVYFDIANPAAPVYQGRLENAFPRALPAVDNQYGYNSNEVFGTDKGIVVGWQVVDKTERVDGNLVYEDGFVGLTTGKTGSMARFAIYKDYLYSVMNNELYIFNLQGDKPVRESNPIHVGWDAETIFSYKDNMFFGTPRGMIIYSVANPLNPVRKSELQHVYGCDPVVVENDIAYVTIWAGNNCGQSANELIIIDVSDVSNPKQIVSYTMTSPKGLGIDNGTLFVCDEGLKIFDAADPQTIMSHKLAHYEGMNGYDVIPANNVLMMIAEDGLYQYDYSDLTDIKELSKLPFGN